MVSIRTVVCSAIVTLSAWGAQASEFITGRQLLAEGRYPEARVSLTEALELAEKTQPASRNLAIVLDSLGTLESQVGNFGAAERDFSRARTILAGGSSTRRSQPRLPCTWARSILPNGGWPMPSR